MTENNNLRNNAFEEFKRTHPDVKELATVWRGSTEDIAWRELYLKEGQTFEYIENEQVVTFYRALSPKEVEKKAEEAVVTEEPPKFYTDLGVVHNHSTPEQTHRQTWIKLAKPRKAPVGDRWAEVEYVLVDQFRQRIELEGQTPFDFYETQVIISDDDKTNYSEENDAQPIYKTPGWLDPWQVLWAIGELEDTAEEK